MDTLEEDISCAVCCDTYTDPVVLTCSHSFCRQCIGTYWKDRVIKECPICRCQSPTDSPPGNLVLKNIVEACNKEKARRSALKKGHRIEESQGRRDTLGKSKSVEERVERCSHHGERLLLYCMEDQEALCVVCQTARKHKDHQLCPLEEAALDLKEEIRASLIPLRGKLDNFQNAKKECMKTEEHIKNQAKQTKQRMKREFEELRQFLNLEEQTRLAAFEDEVKTKTTIITEKIQHAQKRETSLSDTIQELECEIERRDIAFLKVGLQGQQGKCTLPNPEPVKGVLIDVARHLSNLRFKVWEKMKENMQHTPVTLDPNTAAPWLSLSDNLTSVHYLDKQPHIPDNPERCDTCVCVVGAEAFASGTHVWDVDVGTKTRWDLGVMRENVSRKGVLNVYPSQGFWAVALRDGKYNACTMPWTRLTLTRKLTRVRVCLDYDQGKVSFYNPVDRSLLYTFHHKFSERLRPYFSPCVGDNGRNAEPLKICPSQVSVFTDLQ
ncbi:zinc-binding protein A33-like [Aplochiton taeniatus]